MWGKIPHYWIKSRSKYTNSQFSHLQHKVWMKYKSYDSAGHADELKAEANLEVLDLTSAISCSDMEPLTRCVCVSVCVCLMASAGSMLACVTLLNNASVLLKIAVLLYLYLVFSDLPGYCRLALTYNLRQWINWQHICLSCPFLNTV